MIAAAEKVARDRGWPADWLNDKAAQFLPNGFGRVPEWAIIYEDAIVTIEVATPEMLLAMKLHAAQIRRLRELEDLGFRGLVSASWSQLVARVRGRGAR